VVITPGGLHCGSRFPSPHNRGGFQTTRGFVVQFTYDSCRTALHFPVQKPLVCVVWCSSHQSVLEPTCLACACTCSRSASVCSWIDCIPIGYNAHGIIACAVVCVPARFF